MRFPVRFLSGIVVAVSAALCVAAVLAARASGTIVPGTYRTIQGAVDSTSADSIYVQTGEYAEDLHVKRDLVLLAYPRNGYYQVYYDAPVVRSLHVTTKTASGTISAFRMYGFHVRGAVLFDNDGGGGVPEFTLEGCRLDAGFTGTPGPSNSNTFAFVRFRGCLVFGGASLQFYYPTFVNNAFIGGGLTVSGNGSVFVRGNYFAGPGDIGLSICCSDGIPVATDNTITGFRVGISASASTSLTGNKVEDCSEDGIDAGVGSHPGSTTVVNNIVRSCGGNGIHVQGPASATIRGNTVDSVGAVGVRVDGLAIVRANTIRTTGSHGIAMQSGVDVAANLVLGALGDGIRASTSACDSNVVGRCSGAGIRASGDPVRSNTVYLNLGSGFVLGAGTGVAVNHNIAYGNHGYGLDASGTTSPVLGCNDWYSNAAGATLGVPPHLTDLSVDPRFCDLPGDDVSLAASSPLLSAGACGLVGALGLGCSVPVTAVETSSSVPARLRAAPLPARERVRLSWGSGTTPSTIEVFDVTGALRRRATLPVGAGEWVWDTRDSEGRSVDAGVYFVRRTSGDRVESSRVVIQR